MDLWHDLLLADLSGRGGDIVKTEGRRYETLLNGRSYSQAWPRFGSTLWLISKRRRSRRQLAWNAAHTHTEREREREIEREMREGGRERERWRERRTDGEKERRRERYVPLSGT